MSLVSYFFPKFRKESVFNLPQYERTELGRIVGNIKNSDDIVYESTFNKRVDNTLSQQLLGERVRRTGLIIQNLGGGDLYINFKTPANLNAGILVHVGNFYPVNPDRISSAAIYAFSTSKTNVAVVEHYV